VFEKMAKATPTATFVSVDVEASELNQALAQASAVRAFPTFHFYRRGMRVDELMGADTARLQHILTTLQVTTAVQPLTSHPTHDGLPFPPTAGFVD
jgi:hypothetical protein